MMPSKSTGFSYSKFILRMFNEAYDPRVCTSCWTASHFHICHRGQGWLCTSCEPIPILVFWPVRCREWESKSATYQIHISCFFGGYTDEIVTHILNLKTSSIFAGYDLGGCNDFWMFCPWERCVQEGEMDCMQAASCSYLEVTIFQLAVDEKPQCSKYFVWLVFGKGTLQRTLLKHLRKI